MKLIKSIVLTIVALSLLPLSAKACNMSVVDTTQKDNPNGYCILPGSEIYPGVQITCLEHRKIAYSWSVDVSQVISAILTMLGQEPGAALVSGTTLKITGQDGYWSYDVNVTKWTIATVTNPLDHLWTCVDANIELGQSGYNNCKNTTFQCFADVTYTDCLGNNATYLHNWMGSYGVTIADSGSGSCP